MQITNPLIMKNNSTPVQPYEVTGNRCGNTVWLGRPKYHLPW